MPGIDITGNTYTLSQSWVNTFMNCPEQARREMLGRLPRKESDATAIGSAMHTGIETVLRGGSYAQGIDAATAKLDELMALPEFQFVQIKTPETAHRTLERVYWTWCNEIYPQLPSPALIEHPFNVVIHKDSERTIRLRGAIDMVDQLGEIWDWKSAARPYEQWEIDRFKIQPTAYAMGLIMSTDPQVFDGIHVNDQVTFNYAVMMKSSQDCSVYSTVRNPEHWSWFTAQCVSIVKLIEADLDSWPLNDQHALCSPKWCAAWYECKGSHGL